MQEVRVLHQRFPTSFKSFMCSIACQRPYKVIIITQELHDPNKGCRVIKSPTVGPRTSLGLLHQARGFMGFFIVYQGFRTISRVFSIINKVFNIFSKVVASRSSLVGTGTLSTGYKVLQGTNPCCNGSKALQGAKPLCKGSRHDRWDLVASMTSCGATASPCWHQ